MYNRVQVSVRENKTALKSFRNFEKVWKIENVRESLKERNR